MPVSEETYRQLALEDFEGQWELHCGGLVQKPGMSYEHGYLTTRLLLSLGAQLDEQQFTVRSNHARTRTSGSSYLPDVCVVPMEFVRPHRGERGLECYDSPLPLVVEIWSPSTGDYDLNEKLGEHQRRGDLEIWLIHPYDRTLTAWRRQSDGSSTDALYTSGVISPVALPSVTINLDTFFD
jgi:Uma2 family endonuclease